MTTTYPIHVKEIFLLFGEMVTFKEISSETFRTFLKSIISAKHLTKACLCSFYPPSDLVYNMMWFFFFFFRNYNRTTVYTFHTFIRHLCLYIISLLSRFIHTHFNRRVSGLSAEISFIRNLYEVFFKSWGMKTTYFAGVLFLF